jgi:hypothetical protein
MKKIDCLVIGGATQDLMFYTDDSVIIKNPNTKDITRQKLIAFEYGAKLNAQAAYFTMGGGAQNVSVAMAKLGLRVSILTAIGDDGVGEEIRKNLKASNVDFSLMKVYPKDRSSFSFIVNTGTFKEHVIFSYRGANYVFKLDAADLKKFKTKWFYVTSLQGDSWRKNLHTIFQTASEKSIKLAWNPGGTQLAAGYKFIKQYLKFTEVFHLNKDEATELVLSYGKRVFDIEKLLITIKSWGPAIVVITDGANGGYAFDGKKIYYKKALNIKGICTTGAGDSFCSTFVWALMKYHDIRVALQAGIINSNNVITEIGAENGLLTARQIKKELKV